MKSVYFRNFVLSSSMVVFSFLIMGISFVSLTYRVVLNEKKETMSTNATVVVQSVESSYNKGFPLYNYDHSITLKLYAMITGAQIFLTDANGYIVNCSDNFDSINGSEHMECEHYGLQISNPLITEIINRGEFSGMSNLGIYNGNQYVAGLPVVYERTGETVGYVFVTAKVTSMVNIWRSFAGVFLLVSSVIIASAILFSLITSKRQARPLQEMAAAARQFAKGDFSKRVQQTLREDEIGELTVAFNLMADAMEKAENLRREFVANVSHELKTPMTTITGFADGILDGTIPQEMQRDYLAVISDETKRMSRLVGRMLDVTRIQAMDKETLNWGKFDISEVLRRTLLSLENKINGRGLGVNAQLPEESMMTQGDSDGITQVAYNLLDNAIKFAESGSEISLSLWKQGNKAYVSVKNIGPSIAKEELPLIFDRFHKTDRSRSQDKDGVGLGLYIVKTIMNRHGEKLYVTSEDGVTEFVFTLELV